MMSVRTVFICTLFQFFIFTATAQTSSVDEVWLPIEYVKDVKQNKTFLNKKKFCTPIEAIITRDGKPYFKTYLGRVAKAIYESQGNNRYEIKNVQPNINRKFSSWDAYENHRFIVVRQPDTILLLIKSPEGTSNDTTKFIAPVSKKFATPIHAVEGYLLLQGKYHVVDKGMGNRKREVFFDLDGNVVSPNWKSYKLLAASMLLEDKTLENPRTFLIQLQDLKGNMEERVILHYGKKELELYKYTRNAKHRYVLDVDSKITLIGL